jgi:Co/Zn/Cd efflux system component
MAAAIALTFAFVTAEAVAGYFGHSLALMSDAGHNLADVAALSGRHWTISDFRSSMKANEKHQA